MRVWLLAALFAVACKADVPAVELPAPWQALSPAVEVGVVETTAPDELHVRYDDAERAAVMSRWAKVLEKDGWKGGDPIGLPGIVTARFVRGTETLDLTVSSRGTRVDVLVTP